MGSEAALTVSVCVPPLLKGQGCALALPGSRPCTECPFCPQDGSALNISTPPPEEARQDQADDRKDLPWGAHFELPLMLLETDRYPYSPLCRLGIAMLSGDAVQPQGAWSRDLLLGSLPEVLSLQACFRQTNGSGRPSRCRVVTRLGGWPPERPFSHCVCFVPSWPLRPPVAAFPLSSADFSLSAFHTSADL